MCVSECMHSSLFLPTDLELYYRTLPPTRFIGYQCYLAVVAMLWWRDVYKEVSGEALYVDGWVRPHL